MHLHHPWRAFREHVDWRLRWARLPDGVWGETCFSSRTVTLTLGMTQAERRCTIAHETEHIRRGPAPAGLQTWEERLVDQRVSHLLLPDVEQIADALAWSRNNVYVAAHELWVDEFMLESRLKHLLPSEKRFLEQRFVSLDREG